MALVDKLFVLVVLAVIAVSLLIARLWTVSLGVVIGGVPLAIVAIAPVLASLHAQRAAGKRLPCARVVVR